MDVVARKRGRSYDERQMSVIMEGYVKEQGYRTIVKGNPDVGLTVQGVKDVIKRLKASGATPEEAGGEGETSVLRRKRGSGRPRSASSPEAVAKVAMWCRKIRPCPCDPWRRKWGRRE